jgi:hypothetical protein
MFCGDGNEYLPLDYLIQRRGLLASYGYLIGVHLNNLSHLLFVKALDNIAFV